MFSPRLEPAPSPRHSLVRRFWRILRLLALFSMVLAAVAVILVARGDSGTHARMLIATALGVGLAVLLGTSLMVLVLLSRRSGDDNQAQAPPEIKE